MDEKAPFLLAGTGIMKIISVASGLSPFKIHYFDYPKHFINRINFIYNHLFCCIHTCYCVGTVSVMSASHYVTSVSHYQSSSLMYILYLRSDSKEFFGIGQGSSD